MANTNSTTSYLDPPQLIGRPNADGTISITPLELKKLNDYNYYVAKMLQGGLNLANLNGDTNKVFSDIEGNLTTVTATAAGLTTRVSNAEGNITSAQQTANSASVTASNALGQAQQVKLTVDGLTIANETGSYTIIDGDMLTSVGGAKQVTINDGAIVVSSFGGQYGGAIEYDSDGSMLIYTIFGIPIKIDSSSNMSIDSNGTIYIGASSGKSGDVEIGQAGGAIHLVGDIYHNGIKVSGVG